MDHASGGRPVTRRPTGAFGYPVFLELRGRTVLVAGGGAEAAGKILGLVGVGARVVAWAPRHDQTAAFDGDEQVELVAGPFDRRCWTTRPSPSSRPATGRWTARSPPRRGSRACS